MEERPPEDSHDPYEEARREAGRVRMWLNILVVLSAAASSIFLVYVIMRILPRGSGDAGNVEMPTSSAKEKVGVLRGQTSEGKVELSMELRDLDEAEGYREKYSEELRTALGVSEPGRLYAFSVRNLSKSEGVEFAGGTITLREKGGAEHVVSWLATVAKPASALGRMTLTQSEAKFTLAPGERRELYVFVAAKGDMPPAAADLAGGRVECAGLPTLKLEHVDVTIGR
ncbi:MAG: hypothetical protein KBG84_07260 [Planctomycetes bacterium]|nr:hypothetical protein [Planctomycetota bacterium]